jgi:ferric-dicitrate binding protein FerR (iron transport regulator)
MKRHLSSAFAALTLLIAFVPACLHAQNTATSPAKSGGAMLYANGSAKVNGESAGISTSVFPGDRIDVTDSSAVSINRSGSSIVVSPDSTIQYDPVSIQVLQGTARVSTSQGMTVRAGNVVVTPKDATAKFDVTATGNNLTVVSREGALTVDDGGKSVAVAPGAKTTLAFTPAAGEASAPNQSATGTIATDRLAEHPFYGVTKGVGNSAPTLPICANILTCIRPSISNIGPCCCPPRIMCNQ